MEGEKRRPHVLRSGKMARTEMMSSTFAGMPAQSTERGFAGAVTNFLTGIADGWRAFQRWSALETLSNAQLRQLGLRREDAVRYAMFGRTLAPTE